VLRRAASEYLKRRHRDAITAQYQKAYAEAPGLGEDFEVWEDQGLWPTE
jgi:hypothetical protein